MDYAKRLISFAMQDILHTMAEGVHIIDNKGITVLYNRAMEQIEGLSAADVIGKPLLEAFPWLDAHDSTLLTVLKTGRIIEEHRQSYLNAKNKRINTINTTFPIKNNSEIIGALEIAKNYTDVSNLSERLIDLQQKMIKPTSTDAKKYQRYTFDMLVGREPSYMTAIGIAKKAAKTSSSVLIEGETGTGKELFAQSIHNECSRASRPFIAINCAAMPDTLLESILFGTSKGSYTGAEERPGLFEQANDGTLFLDEINSMSLQLQSKILRALQENSIRRLGGLKDILVDVRIIAASNESLHDMMKSGNFRKDLYYRLNVINIIIPPLRDRKGDITLLVDYFIRYFNKKMNKDVWMLSPELIDVFKNYEWIGNVRELQNVIESAMAMVSDEHVLCREHLPAHVDISQTMDHDTWTTAKPQFEGKLSEYMLDVEKSILNEIMAMAEGNISLAARYAGISRQSLQYKLKRHNYHADKL